MTQEKPLSSYKYNSTYADVRLSQSLADSLSVKFANAPKFKFLVSLLNDMDLARMSPGQQLIRETLLSNLAQLHPFLIARDVLHGGNIIVRYDDTNLPDLPFKFCSFEIAGTAGHEMLFNLPAIKDDDGEAITKCLDEGTPIPATAVLVALCYELQPGTYYFCTLEVWDEHLSCSVWKEISDGKENVSACALYPMVRELLKIFSTKAFGTVGLRPYLQVGRGRHKTSVRPKNIVFIGPTRGEKRSVLSHPVDWTHRWEVMGHWRAVTGVGKDREGDYCIPGRTWVKNHVKGKGELVKKTRYVLPPGAPNELRQDEGRQAGL